MFHCLNYSFIIKSNSKFLIFIEKLKPNLKNLKDEVCKCKLEENSNGEEDRKFYEVSDVHGLFPHLKHKNVDFEVCHVALMIKSSHYFLIFDVSQRRSLKYLIDGWSFQNISCDIDVWVPNILHDSIHNFSVKNRKNAMFRNVPQQVSAEQIILLQNKLELIRRLKRINYCSCFRFQLFDDCVAPQEINLEVLRYCFYNIYHNNQAL